MRKVILWENDKDKERNEKKKLISKNEAVKEEVIRILSDGGLSLTYLPHTMGDRDRITIDFGLVKWDDPIFFEIWERVCHQYPDLGLSEGARYNNRFLKFLIQKKGEYVADILYFKVRGNFSVYSARDDHFFDLSIDEVKGLPPFKLYASI